MKIYWCKECNIPYYSKEGSCLICKQKGDKFNGNSLTPVYLQEKKLLSHILNKDVTNENMWFKGNSMYILNGKSIKIPYVKFYKDKEFELIGDKLRNDISFDDRIFNKNELLKANESHINSIIFEAERYTEDITKEYKEFVPIVSFSGGKDSTVVSSIVQDALQKKDIIHILADTTLEFPDTYKYKNTFREENIYTPLLESKPNGNFFSLCEYLGPPSRLERWCCTIFKTSNFNSFLRYIPNERNILSFMGIRRSESINRKNYSRTREESKISKQVVAMPIIEWSDFDVWLYILYKDLNFNAAYKLGYRRVGCWCCPNNSSWSELLTAIYYPELFEKWKSVLYDFAKKTKKINPIDYIENEKWKARKGASGLKSRNVDIVDTDCLIDKNTRNIILEKSLTKKFIEFIKPFGNLKINRIKDGYKIYITDENTRVFDLYFEEGSRILKVYMSKDVDKVLLMNRIKCQIRKYQFCIYCSACDATCDQLAISTFNNEYKINEEKCTHCKKCIGKFYNGCLTSQVLADKK